MINQERFTLLPVERDGKPPRQYIFDRYIFVGMILILLFFSIITMLTLGLDANKYFYVKCDTHEGGLCENPFYNNTKYCGVTIDKQEYICNTEFLYDGFEAGKKPPILVNEWGTVVFVLVALAFTFNHLLYNRGVFK